MPPPPPPPTNSRWANLNSSSSVGSNSGNRRSAGKGNGYRREQYLQAGQPRQSPGQPRQSPASSGQNPQLYRPPNQQQSLRPAFEAIVCGTAGNAVLVREAQPLGNGRSAANMLSTDTKAGNASSEVTYSLSAASHPMVSLLRLGDKIRVAPQANAAAVAHYRSRGGGNQRFPAPPPTTDFSCATGGAVVPAPCAIKTPDCILNDSRPPHVAKRALVVLDLNGVLVDRKPYHARGGNDGGGRRGRNQR